MQPRRVKGGTRWEIGAPGPLSQETLVAVKMAGLALLHVDGDAMGGRDRIVILGGAGHSDLMRPLAQTLQLPEKPF